MDVFQNELTSTLDGLNAGIHVKHIATTKLVTCLDSEVSYDVLSPND